MLVNYLRIIKQSIPSTIFKKKSNNNNNLENKISKHPLPSVPTLIHFRYYAINMINSIIDRSKNVSLLPSNHEAQADLKRQTVSKTRFGRNNYHSHVVIQFSHAGHWT